MSDDRTPSTPPLVCSAEQVLDADPAAVWALVGDPLRVGEWAAIEAVGYLGTELPKVGHIVFLRTQRWQRRSSPQRVEVESWEAGAGYVCVVEPGRLLTSIRFSVALTPEVTSDGIATRLRLTQQVVGPRPLLALLRGRLCRSLEAKLRRVAKAVRS